MDTQIKHHKHHKHDGRGQQVRDLHAGEPCSVIGSRGTVVRCLNGLLWVTQEGDSQDYVVPPGARYCAGSNGRIVISAVAEDTRIAVYRVTPLPATVWSRNVVRFDANFVESIYHAARRERARLLSAVAGKAWRCVQRTWRRLVQSHRHNTALSLGARRYNR